MRKKTFVWARLYTSFFDSPHHEYLISLPDCDGAHIVLIYIWLCAISINDNGVLCNRIGNIVVPYDARILSSKFPQFGIDEMERALDELQKIDLLRRNEDGILRIVGYDRMVGRETGAAIEKRGKDIEPLPWEVPFWGPGEEPEADACDSGENSSHQESANRAKSSHQENKSIREKEIILKQEQRGRKEGEEEGGMGGETQTLPAVAQTTPPIQPSDFQSEGQMSMEGAEPAPAKKPKAKKSRKKKPKEEIQESEMPALSKELDQRYTGPVVFEFRTNDEPYIYKVHQGQVDIWSKQYPLLDVMSILIDIRQWQTDESASQASGEPKFLRSHLKTTVGMPRCITTWMRKEQAKAEAKKDQPPSQISGYQQSHRPDDRPTWQLEKEAEYRRNHPDYSTPAPFGASSKGTGPAKNVDDELEKMRIEYGMSPEVFEHYASQFRFHTESDPVQSASGG